MEKTYIIKRKTGLQRLDQIMQELNIVAGKDPLIYVKLGYRNLSLQDKETFYLLWDLCKLNQKQKNESICCVGTDYMATAFNTTESCQLKRINNLIRSELIQTIDKNTYRINHPLPDSSFFTTMVRLLRRKQLSEYLNVYNNCYNPALRIELLLRIRRLERKGAYHKDLKKHVTTTHALRPSSCIR